MEHRPIKFVGVAAVMRPFALGMGGDLTPFVLCAVPRVDVHVAKVAVVGNDEDAGGFAGVVLVNLDVHGVAAPRVGDVREFVAVERGQDQHFAVRDDDQAEQKQRGGDTKCDFPDVLAGYGVHGVLLNFFNRPYRTFIARLFQSAIQTCFSEALLRKQDRPGKVFRKRSTDILCRRSRRFRLCRRCGTACTDRVRDQFAYDVRSIEDIIVRIVDPLPVDCIHIDLFCAETNSVKVFGSRLIH